MTSSTKREWLVPALLILLSAVPMIAGAVRVTQLAGGDVTPDNARFFASPVPVLVHIVGASLYCVLGALQFVPGLRRRRNGWHRVAGRVLIPCGIAAALSGMWMTLFHTLPASDGTFLGVQRIVFGSAMVAFIVLGFLAIRRRDIKQHRAWMVRGYAIGQGAGTQVFTLGPWALLVGEPSQLTKAVLMGAAWLINIAVAEWVIRKRLNRTSRIQAGRTADRVLVH